MRGAKHAGCLLLSHALLLCRLVVCFDVHDILYVYPHSLIVPAFFLCLSIFRAKGGRVDVQRYPVKPAMANARPWGSTGVKIWFTYALPELPLLYLFSVFACENLRYKRGQARPWQYPYRLSVRTNKHDESHR